MTQWTHCFWVSGGGLDGSCGEAGGGANCLPHGPEAKEEKGWDRVP